MQASVSAKRNLREWIGVKVKAPSTRPFAVIAKSTDICNYKCTYCYVEHNSCAPIMSLDTARTVIEKIARYIGGSRKISFIWHGGEPLMAGSSFFEEVVAFSERFPDCRIEHCIQTNGSFLTEEFLRFAKERGVSVSLSFDGPEIIHDANRLDMEGRGTHRRTLEALAKLKEAGLVAGCVCVLHRQNVGRIPELYAFFKENGINFRVNPVVRSGRAVSNYNSLAIEPREYGRAMIELFDLWFGDDACGIQVEPLYTIVGNFVGPTVWGCDYGGRCLESIVSINPDGSVYPCGRFAGLEKFRLGDIREDSFDTIFSSDLYHDLSHRDADTVEGCQDCAFREICNGGCMITAHMARGDIRDQDYYCQGRKMLFAHIAKHLECHLAEAASRAEKGAVS